MSFFWFRCKRGEYSFLFFREDLKINIFCQKNEIIKEVVFDIPDHHIKKYLNIINKK